ncbi:MAG: hypothetical protein HY221_00390 [Candidatus Sungbacteria bacterium]|uniref:General secretion pathway GspH domain-containing protein n=1 Tax=Candidatus Sungiibacteriota bacterium TaxID=2750080 RepID=A0A932QXS0_9BACT|nr:hypothetical protein [Candidatus Sungbacteria bacterium]
MVVLTLFLVLGSFALLVSTDTYRGSSFRSDRDLLVALLQHARAQSISNVCAGSSCADDGAKHGVHVDGTNHIYTAFTGTSYVAGDPQNQIFEEAPTVTPTPTTFDVVFNQLDGTIASAQTIKLDALGKTSTITIDPSGKISWTN